jgi:hypothetical protein
VVKQSRLSLDERDDDDDDSGESDHAIDEMMTSDQRCVTVMATALAARNHRAYHNSLRCSHQACSHAVQLEQARSKRQ